MDEGTSNLDYRVLALRCRRANEGVLWPRLSCLSTVDLRNERTSVVAKTTVS